MTNPPPPGNYPPGYYPPPLPYPPARSTNGMAIAALVSALVFAPAGIVFGHIALSQIKRTGEDGRGMALAGLILGYVLTLVSIVTVVIFIMVGMFVVDRANTDPGVDHSGHYSSAGPFSTWSGPQVVTAAAAGPSSPFA